MALCLGRQGSQGSCAASLSSKRRSRMHGRIGARLLASACTLPAVPPWIVPCSPGERLPLLQGSLPKPFLMKTCRSPPWLRCLGRDTHVQGRDSLLDSLPPAAEDMVKLRVVREESHPKSISLTILLKLKRLFLSSSFSS